LRFNLQPSRTLGTGAAIAALALAACRGGGGSPGPNPTPVPIATVNPSASPGASGTPTAATIGVAYLPDGGNAGGFSGLQIVNFEDTLGHLLPNVSTSSPKPVVFPGAVGPFTISNDGFAAIAAVSTSTSPTYTRVQSVFGTNANATVPVGPGYDVTQVQPSAPTQAPSPGSSASPLPSAVPVLSKVTSLSIYGLAQSTQAVGVVAGPDTTGFLGLTQLSNAGPVFGGFVPYAGQTPAPIVASRPHVIALASTNVSTLLARGPQDLLAYAVAIGGTGYTFTVGADDTTLGLAATTLGSGVMALDPADGTRAMIGQTNPGDGSANGVTLVTGLPGKATHAMTISVNAVPHSIAITAGGGYAVVGTDQGFVVIAGVDSGTLTLLPAFAPAAAPSTFNHPSYTGCDGNTYQLANVSSVGFSGDQAYLAALGNQPAAACAGGRTASLVVVPFNQTTGTSPTPGPTTAASATPAPTSFVQNNIIAPPIGQDYLFVR